MAVYSPNKCKGLTVLEYLHGKVADYTVSENVIVSVCYDRGLNPNVECGDTALSDRELSYADLLKYIYLQPNMTKSYSDTNGTWSHKEGSTQLSAADKKAILAEMRRIYTEYGEEEKIPQTYSSFKVFSGGMRL